MNTWTRQRDEEILRKDTPIVLLPERDLSVRVHRDTESVSAVDKEGYGVALGAGLELVVSEEEYGVWRKG